MKKVINYFICMATTFGLSYAADAQEFSSNTRKLKQDKSLTEDSTRNQRMETDLNKRTPTSNNQSVTWKESTNGYNGTYWSNHVQYMAQYDKDGNYVESLTKKEWNDNAPATLRSSYQKSPYKSQKVTAYWEVTDPGKGYFLELNDNQNNHSSVWVNEDGKFSSSPFTKIKE